MTLPIPFPDPFAPFFSPAEVFLFILLTAMATAAAGFHAQRWYTAQRKRIADNHARVMEIARKENRRFSKSGKTEERA